MYKQAWFDKQGLKVLRSFPVLWKFWELDSEWYLCERENGERVLVTSDHEDLRIDASADELQQKIDEYKGVLAESEEIMRILKGELTD
jgi:hypothetical protein